MTGGHIVNMFVLYVFADVTDMLYRIRQSLA